jgi:hypothetical protein
MALFQLDCASDARNSFERALEVHDSDDEEEVQLLEEAKALIFGEGKP